MNAITKDAQSYDFSTAEGLFATPLVRRFTDMPETTGLVYGDKLLMACNGQFLSVVGTLKEPVRLPKDMKIKRTFAQDQ